jgi:hypothetical protein
MKIGDRVTVIPGAMDALRAIGWVADFMTESVDGKSGVITEDCRDAPDGAHWSVDLGLSYPVGIPERYLTLGSDTMKRSKSIIELLHIGGVMDGRWRHVKGQFASYPASGANGFESHHYRRETLATPDAVFDVMIYSVATTGGALSMLIQGYRPSVK